jgi:hypothetical protein
VVLDPVVIYVNEVKSTFLEGTGQLRSLPLWVSTVEMVSEVAEEEVHCKREVLAETTSVLHLSSVGVSSCWTASALNHAFVRPLRNKSQSETG